MFFIEFDGISLTKPPSFTINEPTGAVTLTLYVSTAFSPGSIELKFHVILFPSITAPSDTEEATSSVPSGTVSVTTRFLYTFSVLFPCSYFSPHLSL